jgi:hypothetical protein
MKLATRSTPSHVNRLTPAELCAIGAEIVDRAIAEGRHSEGGSKHVCADCREFKFIYFETGTGGGSGIAGRKDYCLKCGIARGFTFNPSPNNPFREDAEE